MISSPTTRPAGSSSGTCLTSALRMTARAASRPSAAGQAAGRGFMMSATAVSRAMPRSRPRRTSPSVTVPTKRCSPSITRAICSALSSMARIASRMVALSRTSVARHSLAVRLGAAAAMLSARRWRRFVAAAIDIADPPQNALLLGEIVDEAELADLRRGAERRLHLRLQRLELGDDGGLVDRLDAADAVLGDV